MPLAFLSAGAPVEILPDHLFVTTTLLVGADEAEHYEVPAGTVINLETPHTPQALARWGPEDRARYGVQVFGEVEPAPAGERIVTRSLIVTDGVISATATYAPIAVEDARAQQLAAAAVQYQAHRQSPMSWDFAAVHAIGDAGDDRGPAGVQTLQMRDDAANDDLKNWLAAAQGASAMVMGGAGGAVLPLKTSGNVWVQTTATQTLQVLVTGDGVQPSALARGQAMLAHYGALKAQIAVAADTSAVLAIDVTAGWPT